jgi:hypothetical protein
MLRKFSIAIALAGFMAGFAYAGSDPQTGIVGSLHDMNVWADANQMDHDVYRRACVFCHTPHNAQPSINGYDNGAPLWNRADTGWGSGGQGTSAYGWVAPKNITTDGLTASLPFNSDPLVGPSRLCLSCHDGSVAADSHGSNGAQNGKYKMGTANRSYVNDLTLTHPIGFKYADAVTARGLTELAPATNGFLAAPSTSLTGDGFDTEARAGLAKSSTTIAETLYKGYMTCATCHDIHNSKNAKSDTGRNYNYQLRARQEGSAICLSCHIK